MFLSPNYIKNKKKKSIYIFGDSHSKCFGKKSLNVNEYILTNLYCPSASMKGLTNPNSFLKYNNKIIKYLDLISHDVFKERFENICIFKFGQVDIEYNIHYKIHHKKENIDVNKFIRTLVNNYINYILTLTNKYKNIRFIVNGINMPNVYNINNYILKGVLPKGEKLLYNIKYKTQFNWNYIFNRILLKQCITNKIPYFDLTKGTTINNTIRKKFIGFDNHFSGAEAGRSYDKHYTYQFFQKKLLEAIK